MATPPTDVSPRLPRPAAYSNDLEYEDKPAVPPPPPRRPHHGSSASPVAPAADLRSPLRARHSEPVLLGSPRDADEYPRFEARKRMSADFSDDTLSVGSISGESPKASDRSSWRLHSAVAGPFLTGPLAKDFQSEHLKTPRGKTRDDMNFDYSGLLFPLAPVLDTIPDTPRGGYNHQQAQGFTDISQFENSSAPMDSFHLDGAARGAPVSVLPSHSSSQYYAGPAAHGSSNSYGASSQNGQQSSSAMITSQSTNHAHGASYGDVIARNGSSSMNNAQSLVASTGGTDSFDNLSKGMADSMAQILAKTQSGRTYNEVQLTSLVQKIHLHMNIMGRTSAAIREDYNRIKAKLEQTITDKKVLEATNYHLQQLVQQYEVERQYFHQYVLHSLQSQSSLIYESMGSLSQNVEQSKATIEELSVRLSHELSNIQGARGNDSQLKEILEEIKRAMDVSAVADAGRRPNQSPARSLHHHAAAGKTSSGSEAANGADEGKKAGGGGGFRLTPVLLAVLLWVATLGGVYFSAKSAALSELQQSQPSSSLSSIRTSDLELIVNQISQKLDSSIQASEVRKLVFTELKQNPQLVESVVVDAVEEADAGRESSEYHDEKEDKTAEHMTLQPEEVAAPVVPSVPSVETEVDAADVIEIKSAEPTTSKDAKSEIAVDDGVPKVDEAAVVPVEPTVEAPSFPDTVAPEVVPETKQEVVEVGIPAAKPFQVPDAAIAEMLRLNGLPAGVIPLDQFPGAVVGSMHPPIDVVETAKKSVEPEAESVVESDSLKKELVVDLVDGASAVASEPHAAEPVDVKDDVAGTDSSADVVEIAIENALNPEVIVRDETSTSKNETSVIAAVAIQEVVESVAAHPPVGVAIDDLASTVESTTNESPDAAESSPERVDSEPLVSEVKSGDAIEEFASRLPVEPTEVSVEPVKPDQLPVEPVEGSVVPVDAELLVHPTGQEIVKEETFAGKAETDGSSVETASVSSEVPEIQTTVLESVVKNAEVKVEPNVMDEETKTNVADESASLSWKENSVDEKIASGDDLAAETAADASGVADTASSVLDSITGSIPFTGLSKALKSLAHRFVEGGEVSEASVDEVVSEKREDASGRESIGVTEVVDPAKHEETVEVKAEEGDEAMLKSDIDGVLTAGVEAIPSSVESAIESPLAADVTESPSEAGTDSMTDLVTVEVAIEGGVADSTPTDVVHDTVPVLAQDAVEEVTKADTVAFANDKAERTESTAASDDQQVKEPSKNKIVVGKEETTASEEAGAPMIENEHVVAAASLAEVPETAVVAVDESVADKGNYVTTIKDGESSGAPSVAAASGDVAASVVNVLSAPETHTELDAEDKLSTNQVEKIDTVVSATDGETPVDAISVAVHDEAARVPEATNVEDSSSTLEKETVVDSESFNLGAETVDDTVEAADALADAELPVPSGVLAGERVESEKTVVDDAIGSVEPVDMSMATASSSAGETATVAASLPLTSVDAEVVTGAIDSVAVAVVETVVGGERSSGADVSEAIEAMNEEQSSAVAVVQQVEDVATEADAAVVAFSQDSDVASDVPAVEDKAPESSSDEASDVAEPVGARVVDSTHAEL